MTEDKPATKTNAFSKEQMEILQQMSNQTLLQFNNSSQGASMVAQKGTFSIALMANRA